MDSFYDLLVLGLLVWAFARTKRLQWRIEILESRLRRLADVPAAPFAGDAASANDTNAATAGAPAWPDAATAAALGAPDFSPAPSAQPPAGSMTDTLGVPPPPPPPLEVVPVPPPPASPVEMPPVRPPPPRGPTIDIDWEQLLGVRAAAVVSAIALGLAGLLFFKYSIEQGLFPPWLRVVLATVVGTVTVAASELALRRQYAGTANALAGGGLVVLYAAFWAASVLYELVSFATGFVLMGSVTVTGCALAWRHRAQVTAVLALVGGFATPLLLSRGSDRPIALFGYLLMLDAGLVALSLRNGWPRLAYLGLVGSALYEAGWILTRMGEDRLLLGLSVLAVFSAVFALAAIRAPAAREWRQTQVAAILFPFAFALYFAGSSGFARHLVPVGALIGLLSAAAGWIGRMRGRYETPLAAAAAGVAVVLAWATTVPPDAGAWPAVAIAVGLALVFHVFVELEPERGGADGPMTPAVVAAVGHGVALAVAMWRFAPTLWPWLAGWALLAALLVRHAALPGRAFLDVPTPALVALALVTLNLVHGAPTGPLSTGGFYALAVAAAAAFQAVALWRGRSSAGHDAHAEQDTQAEQGAQAEQGTQTEHAQQAEHGAGAIAAILAIACWAPPQGEPPAAYFATTLALGLLMALVAARSGIGLWLVGAPALTALGHFTWSLEAKPADAGLGLAAGGAAVALFTAWPFVAGERLRGDRVAWYAAALVAPMWFWPLWRMFDARFGDTAVGVLPLSLGAVSMAAAFAARERLHGDENVRRTAMAWLAAAALAFVSVAIPLQLEKSWITVGWAVEGLAIVWLWTRLDHVGLKYFALLLLGAATVRLVANPEVLAYWPRPSWRIVNWLMYTYLVPAVALVGASVLLQRFELPRLTAPEREILPSNVAVASAACGLAAVVVTFVWLNLAIADWFATGTTLTVSFARLPARDLATSIVWAAYALLLLGIGMAWRLSGLRWVSGALLIVTIAKVFLHDLGELRDLYRVASLVGLAISLLAVSLAYQRFVFRSGTEEEEP